MVSRPDNNTNSMRKRQEKAKVATAAATGHHNNHAEFVDISHPVPLHYHEDDEYEDDKEHHEQSDLRGDRSNIAILFFLYLLQGIPLGLTAAIPMLLQNRGASYKQQAEFSFAHWPFSLKLLWAPIVDSLYYSRFGRRKSWLIPTQYLIGIFMLILSSQVNRWLGSGSATDETSSHVEPNVQLLTFIFFCLNFLAATQDIAVDGWALTMLKPRNVGHASTCNSVGQTAGYFFGYVVFMALESKDFCNTYLGMDLEAGGLITLSGFLWFWGLVFLATTTLVALLKRETAENSHSPEEQGELTISQTYQLLIDIVKMRPIQILAAILMTVKVAFAACDAVSSLKLIDAGVPKDKLALLVVPLVPLQIVLPLVISKYTTGPRPMAVYLKAIPYRLGLTFVAAALVYLTPYFVSPTTGTFPVHYYLLLIVNYSLYQICLYSMFVAIMAFFAKISDPAVGGTYMTLLNTVCNLGGNWPTTVMLWLVDVLTWRKCTMPEGFAAIHDNDCSNAGETEACTNGGGKCETRIDGYYFEVIICMVYGVLWYFWGRAKIEKLQRMPVREWRVVRQQTGVRMHKNGHSNHNSTAGSDREKLLPTTNRHRSRKQHI